MSEFESDLTIVILTFNEQLHIRRCIESLLPISRRILVIDSFSSDRTVDICDSLGAEVYQRAWKNYADQFQWALDHCPIETAWVMRMDADEYVEADLIAELPLTLANAKDSVGGFYIRRKYYFLGKWIKHGSVYPLNLLRVWRVGQCNIEQRWMDEHIVPIGPATILQLKGHIVDDNKNTNRWYTAKHNAYADREMIDILDKKYGLFKVANPINESTNDSQAKVIRFVKERIYNNLPIFLRPTLYFCYRYFIRFGFLDGTRGFAFHFFQGFWYRALVDVRVYEAEVLLEGSNSNKERIARLESLTGLKLA